jgi:hypothetical protein
MLMTEFNIDIAKEVWMDEARERGIQIGEERERRNAEAKRTAAIEALKAQGVSDKVIALVFSDI